MNPIKVVKLAELNDISERNVFITQLNAAIPHSCRQKKLSLSESREL